MHKWLALVLVTLTTASCGAAMPPVQTNDSMVDSTPVSRGLEFAQTHCSTCHAVAALQTSPNREAPPFELVVNRPGLTPATLRSWLRNSHNFPEMMDFAIAPDQIDDLAAYMMTLQSKDFTPPSR